MTDLKTDLAACVEALAERLDRDGDEHGVAAELRTHAPAIAELQARCEALEQDRKRLDYIERTFSGMTNRERYLPVRMIWGKGCNGRTLREACDKYMKRDAAIDASREGEGNG